MTNIIDVFRVGNQELFYSSFIAWLLKPQMEHGYFDGFSNWFFKRIGVPISEFAVSTERSISGGRADIYISTANGVEIVIENKTKSIGAKAQLEKYKIGNALVIPMGLLAENFPIDCQNDVITYSEILEVLKSLERKRTQYSVVVDDFISHLEGLLLPYIVFDKYCNDLMSEDEAKRALDAVVKPMVTENDKRFFHAIYCDRLIRYFVSHHTELIFGTDEYRVESSQNKPLATRWIMQKNLQGPAFMECIVYKNVIPGKSLSPKWLDGIDQSVEYDLSPRLELWIDPYDVFSAEQAGVFLLGCWNNEIRANFKKSGLFKNRGSRNFHHRVLSVSDLKYGVLSSLIREELEKVWVFEGGGNSQILES